MAWWWPFDAAKRSKRPINRAGESPGRGAKCHTRQLGQRGEKLACRFLKKAGLKILARNYRCPGGEIDIIALDTSTRRAGRGETIVFVEVKTRSSETHAGPESAVDAHKRNQIDKAARYYLRHHSTKGYRTRYDVVAVILPDGQEPIVRHTPNAF